MTTVSLNKKKTNSTKFWNDYVTPSTKRLHNAYTNISKRFREWRLKYSLINETCKLQAVTNDAQRFWGKFKGAEKDRKFKTVAYPVNETVILWAKRYEFNYLLTILKSVTRCRSTFYILVTNLCHQKWVKIGFDFRNSRIWKWQIQKDFAKHE